MPLAVLAVQEEDPQAYLARVRRAKEYVRAGDIYQANLSRSWDVRVRSRGGASAAAALYRRLRAGEPGALCGAGAVPGRGDRELLARAAGARGGAARSTRARSPARARAVAAPGMTGARSRRSQRTPRSAPSTSC